MQDSHYAGTRSALGGSPVQALLSAATLRREDTGGRFEATSLPGHLLHCVVSGHVEQQCNGRRYLLRPGSVLWYHEDELVRGVILRGPWVWYSVNFVAPELPPPPYEGRSHHDADGALTGQFGALCRAWSQPQSPLQRSLRCHALLLDILAALLPSGESAVKMDERGRLWWEIETAFRSDPQRPVNIDWMRHHAACSAATVARSCRAAVGMAPMQRIKQIKLSLARGLVQRSSLSLTEISVLTGYPRLHEFSRDFRRCYGLPPSTDRRQHRELSD